MPNNKKKDNRHQPQHAKTQGTTAEKQAFTADNFPIIGIGASAGGLEALNQLFKNMPADTGAGFVVVQHLAPAKESTMPEILQRQTRMPVSQAADEAQVQPDNIYVIPPGKNMAILRGKLQLFEQVETPAHVRHPIDTFLESLARDRGTSAVAIILSGTGTDGTLGARAIKEDLGLVITQDPLTAAYDGMPRSVTESGMADYILPPEEMAKHLLEYIRRLPMLNSVKVEGSTDIKESLPKIITIIRDVTGNDFSDYKEGTLERRIKRRMALHQIETAEDYVRFLQQYPAEKTVLFKELLINVTSFFRDPLAFESLKPRLKENLMNKSSKDEVRAWVAGCASGEEAYSLVILILECLEELSKPSSVQVFATDLDSDAINIARSGIYPLGIAADISSDRLQKYFNKLDDTYQVKKAIREKVVFAVHNVIKDPPFLKMDLVSARNLLIYLKSDLQKRLLPLFHYSLNPQGILLLSPSETVGEFTDLFQIVDRKWKIFQSKGKTSLLQYLPPFSQRRFTAAIPIDKTKEGQAIKKVDIPQLADKILLSEYAPVYVVVDSAKNVVYVRGDTEKYLKLPEGKASTNILDLSRKGLPTYLSLALHQAASMEAEVSRENIKIENNGNLYSVGVTVKPLTQQKPPDYFLVIFREAPIQNKPLKERKSQAAEKGKGTSEKELHITDLEQELQHTRQNLQTTVEELETSNQELKSANEELLSSNEELQSTNEELQTSQEELRSVNEELSTLNNENQDRIDQLTRSQDDMRNLLVTIEVATLYLDKDLNIKSFTPAATKLFSLREGDIGRPISEITSSLKYEDLVKDSRETLRTLVATEKELQTKDGRWYSIRILPYRTQENAITGVVLTFFDIDQRRILQAATRFTQSIVDTIKDPILVLDKDFKVVSANRSFYQTFQTNETQTVGKKLFDLNEKQWDIPRLKKLLEDIGSQNPSFDNFRIEKDFPGLGSRRVLLNASILFDDKNDQRILLTIADVTGVEKTA